MEILYFLASVLLQPSELKQSVTEKAPFIASGRGFLLQLGVLVLSPVHGAQTHWLCQNETLITEMAI